VNRPQHGYATPHGYTAVHFEGAAHWHDRHSAAALLQTLKMRFKEQVGLPDTDATW
jgi:hypothetical protein